MMINRSLLALASLGYRFPGTNTFRSVAPQPSPVTYEACRVRVLRPFYGLRRVLEVGEIVDLIEPEAATAVAYNRAEYVD